MLSEQQLVGLRLGNDSEDRGQRLHAWRLSEPVLAADAGSPSVSTLDYRCEDRFFAEDGVVWLSTLVDDRIIDQRRFRVVREEGGRLESQALWIEADAADLWRQILLLRMTANADAMSVTFLRSDVERVGWIRACVAYSKVVTPWIWGAVDPSRAFAGARAVPERLIAAIEPDMFSSQTLFFGALGERLLGPAGYVGQELNGFVEVLRQLVHVAQHVEITVMDPDRCEAVCEEVTGTKDFAQDVLTALDAVVGVAYQA